MKYTLNITMHYVTKNALQKTLQNQIDQLDQKAYNSLQNLKTDINNAIVYANKQNPRCKPVEEISFMTTTKSSGATQTIVSGVPSLAMDILHISNNLTPQS